MTPGQLDAIISRYAAAVPSDFGDGDPHAAAEAADDAARHTSGSMRAAETDSAWDQFCNHPSDLTWRNYEDAKRAEDDLLENVKDQTEDMAVELGQSLPDAIALMTTLIGSEVDQRQIVDIVAAQARLNERAAAFNARHAGDGMQRILNRMRHAGDVESARRGGTGAEND